MSTWIRHNPTSFKHFDDADRERGAILTCSQNDPTREVKVRVRKRTVDGETSRFDLCVWSRPTAPKQLTPDQQPVDATADTQPRSAQETN